MNAPLIKRKRAMLNINLTNLLNIARILPDKTNRFSLKPETSSVECLAPICYTRDCLSFALAKSIKATTITIKATTVPAL